MPDNEECFVSPPRTAQAPQSFVKFMGKSEHRRDRGDWVMDWVEGGGCHKVCTYSRRPRQVKDGAIMFLASMVGKPNATIICGRAVASAYQEDDDATQADMASREKSGASRSWLKEYPRYLRVHHAEFVAGFLRNGVSLQDLFDELKSNSLMTTQHNAAKGVGETNPRMSVMRAPGARLSNEGYEWLNRKLEEAFQKHGKLDPDQLKQLAWPVNQFTPS